MVYNLIFDSSVWIALLATNDSLHLKAVKVFTDYHHPIYITESIIEEVITVLKRKNEAKGAKEFVKNIYNNTDIIIISQ